MSELDPSVKALIEVVANSNNVNSQIMGKIDKLASNVNELTMQMSKHMVKIEHQDKFNEELKASVKDVSTDIAAFKEYSRPILLIADKKQTKNDFIVRSLTITFIVALSMGGIKMWSHYEDSIIQESKQG